jgi:hypothetical protein
MNHDLFLAILSMDSYNRGYGRGVRFSPNESLAPRNEIGRQIGNAFVTAQTITAEAIDSDFYAIAYRGSQFRAQFREHNIN